MCGLNIGEVLMTGVIHIVVAMKPLDGNFAENAVKHGVAGLNIDGTRIAGPAWKWGTQTDIKGGGFGLKRPSDGDVLARDVEGHPGGRWPSNIIYGHLEGCRRVGMRKVRSAPCANHEKGPYVKDRTWLVSTTPATKTKGYAGEDGFETIEEWSCEEGCPVAELDRQSGIRKSGSGNTRRKKHETKAMAGSLGEPRGCEEVSYGDKGGASRFFKQIGEFKEEEGL